MAQITDLYIYPVKSLKGIALKEAQTAQRGLEYDREWMITDRDYNFISQREIELMTTIETDIDSDSLIFTCLLYTSPSPRDGLLSRMPSSA